MALTLNKKSTLTFEWEFRVPTNFNASLQSETFIVQERSCRLELSCEPNPANGNDADAVLTFKSDKILPKPVNIIVIPQVGTFNSFRLLFNVRGVKQEIWRKVKSSELQNSLLRFEMIIIGNIENDGEAESISGGKNNSSLQKNNSHLRTLSRDFAKLLEDPSSCDVTIKCRGKTYHAHKIVLQARSEFFSSMLRSSMIEGKTGLVELKGIKSETFERLLRYFYSGIVPKLSFDTARDLYEAGDQYCVDGLKIACSDFLSQNLSESNACEILVLADMHSDMTLRKKIVSFIVRKKVPIRCRRNWLDFSKAYSSLACEILNLFVEKYCPK